MKTRLLVFVSVSLFTLNAFNQSDTSAAVKETKTNETKWYEKVSIRGYVQGRYNGLLETNPDLGCEQCDKSWGGDGGFFLRRVRIIFFGQIHPRVYFYIQPDLASSASSTSLHFAQIRDAYFDLSLDKKGEFRFRVGQSKVPYGFENMQSSQNRLPLDRNDAMNSAVSNERDLGVFFYWAPSSRRKMFSDLVKDGLKGSGDYGVVGLGLYNGQTANRPELNTNRHAVARISYPFKVGEQIFEPGIQAYTGMWEMPKSSLSSGVKTSKDLNYKDERLAGTFVMYPKPLGILAEYNIGKGPEFNVFTDSIETQKLKGGFATVSYMIKAKNQTIIPFVRYQYYDGGKKHELDARSYKVEEMEFGIEWQPVKQFELVAMYTMSSRRYEDFDNQNNYQRGNLLRLQAQLNF
jgi:hypothetical protein